MDRKNLVILISVALLAFLQLSPKSEVAASGGESLPGDGAEERWSFEFHDSFMGEGRVEYRLEFDADHIYMKPISGEEEEASEVWLGRGRGGISLRISGARATSLILTNPGDCSGQPASRVALRWLDVITSAAASGLLGEASELAAEARNSFLENYGTCVASVVDREVLAAGSGGIISDGWSASASEGETNQISLWPFNIFRGADHYQTFCYLSMVQLGKPQDATSCRVYFSGTWLLQAQAGDPESSAVCEARCVGILK